MPGDDDFDMDGALAEVSAGLNMENSDGSDRDDTADAGAAGGGDSAGAAPADQGNPAKDDSVPGDNAARVAGDAPTAGAEEAPHAVAPKTWRKEAAELWANLDPRVREEIHKREADIFRGLEGYKADATFARNVQQVLAPFKPLIDQYNIDPVRLAGGLVQTHFAMATAAPEKRAEMFRQLAKDYGVDLQLGGAPASDDAPFVDPAVKTLQAEISGLKSRLESQDRQRFAAVKADTEREVAAFAADKAHPYFDEVASDIAQLLQSGVAKSLKDAYEKAVWANPVTRQKEVDRLAAEKAAKTLTEKSNHAANARRATSANVRTSSRPGSGTAALGTMDDTLNQTFAAIQARS